MTELKRSKSEIKITKVEVRKLFKDSGLTILQIGVATGRGASTVEDWENFGCSQFSNEELKKLINDYRNSGRNINFDNNLLFGQYRLKVGREILLLTIEEMAEKYGYSVATWRKIESNSRRLSSERLKEIERDVKVKARETGLLPKDFKI